MAVEIHHVPVQLVKGVWDELHTQIVSAMRYHNAMDAEDLLRLLLIGRVTMFAAAVDDEIAGCFVVEHMRYPRKDFCNIVAVAGKNGATRSWIKQMLEVLENWALEQGCDYIAGIGRKGWMIAREYGFKTEQRAILTKDISDGRRRRYNGHESGSLGRGPALSPATLRERGPAL